MAEEGTAAKHPPLLSRTKEMMQAHPVRQHVDSARLVGAIAACMKTAEICTMCADHCMADPAPGLLRACIRRAIDCADLCNTTARVMSRQTEPSWKLMQVLLETCAQACADCREICKEHEAQQPVCGRCAAQCRQCEESCNRLLASIAV